MFHQLIKRNDMIPTPSQPIKSWYMLLAVIMISMAIKNKVRYLMNLLMLGSDDMYQVENSIIDHVMNSATGVNTRDSVSSVMVMLMFSVGVKIKGEIDMVSSLLLLSKELSGIVLIINISIKVYFVLLIVWGLVGFRVDRVKEIKIARVIVGVVRSIFYYLDLHQEFWRLRPKEFAVIL